MRRRAVLLAAVVLLATAVGAERAAAFERAVLESVAGVLRPAADDRGAAADRGRLPAPALGSAVALAHGRFITAHHVVQDHERVLLRLDDGRIFEARVTARAAPAGLALLESAAPARPVQWGDAPLVGARVCAVGNAFSGGIAASCGVVARKAVSDAGFLRIEDFLQSDAPAGPGSSGGALVDGKGRLVGVLYAPRGARALADDAVTLAVSGRLTRRVAAALKADGTFRPPAIGATLTRQPPRRPRKHAGAPVTAVRPEGPAARAGLQAGDLLTELAGRAILGPGDAVAALALAEPGATVEAVVRRDGETRTLEIALPDGG
jgi:S1-C subfamily serine protease